jgi:hypothetical protein
MSADRQNLAPLRSTCATCAILVQVARSGTLLEGFGGIVTNIDEEIQAYEALQPSLEAEHLGEWVVMRDLKLIGLYPSAEAASAAAIKQFGRGPYLIRQIGAPPLRLPVSVIHHRHAD